MTRKVETYRGFEIHVSEWMKMPHDPKGRIPLDKMDYDMVQIYAIHPSVPPQYDRMWRVIVAKAPDEQMELTIARIDNALQSCRDGIDQIIAGTAPLHKPYIDDDDDDEDDA